MKLILAQGNPGSEFSGTRHNVGFHTLDAYADKHSLSWAEKSKFQAYLAEYTVAGEKIILAKPTTYYNETGQAARALIDFYKLDPTTEVLVFHDDIALPLGTIRTRGQGSDAGNNGIKSLNAHLGPRYSRARIGIYTDLAARMEATAFVLGKFTAEEKNILADLRPTLFQIIDSFTAGDFALTSYR